MVVLRHTSCVNVSFPRSLSLSHTHTHSVVTHNFLMLFFIPYRASDPDEVFRVHEMKVQREQLQEEESHLDHLIQMCKHELSLLTENQENWQYP